MRTVDPTDIQGLVAHGFGRLPRATFLILAVENGRAARTVLRRWASGISHAGGRYPDSALNIAFTAPGLRALGLPDEAVQGFSAQFVEGMITEHRSRLLGDVDDNDPSAWSWGGPGNPAVHVLALIYARTPELLEARVTAVQKEAAGALRTVMALETNENTGREAFGFRDGLSQPAVAGLRGSDGRGLPTGEFMLGYPNSYGQLTQRPMLSPGADPAGILPLDPYGSGAADLGANGSYLVVRQLSQDVDAFWAYVAEQTRQPDGKPDPAGEARLAAKMVGRWPSGAPLVLAPQADDPSLAGADFGYHRSDPDGVACPMGAHIRRANPRDSLEPQPGSAASQEVTDRHRILRRARTYNYNSTPKEQAAAAEQEQGLFFMCLNANLARQFEFVQHTWLNDPTFNRLHDDGDPLVAPRGRRGNTFTVQARPVRRRYRGLPAFVRVRGGAYFFLPGLSTLRYLGQVGP